MCTLLSNLQIIQVTQDLFPVSPAFGAYRHRWLCCWGHKRALTPNVRETSFLCYIQPVYVKIRSRAQTYPCKIRSGHSQAEWDAL